ncbi:hypothetical protein [Hyphomonas sp.]|uniref:hypothetical protein n=1 Tax=Hyphomonas sp. TaxID=87 RepID=UPI0030F5CFF3
MIRPFATLITSAAILAACVTAPTPNDTDAVTVPASHETIRFDDKRATRVERAACEAAGGKVGPGGMLGFDQCVQPYADAGAACKSAEDCLGRCLLSPDSDDEPGQPTEDGVCQTTDSAFGCMTEVDDGTVQGSLCID